MGRRLIVLVGLFVAACGEVPLVEGDLLSYGISPEIQERPSLVAAIGGCLALWGEAVDVQVARGEDEIAYFDRIVKLPPPAVGRTHREIGWAGAEYLIQATTDLDPMVVDNPKLAQLTLCHETGHVLGLGHPADSPLMNDTPDLGWDGTIDEVAIRNAKARLREGWLSRGEL